MTYYSDTKYLDEIIEFIADTLIAETEWSDGDATWTTTDPSAFNAKRCLYHSDGVYIALESINSNVGASPNYRGLRINFSETWVDNEPVDPLQSMIQFEGINVDLAVTDIQYHLWITDQGFSIIAVPTTGTYRGAWILVMERNTSKLYSDGESNFFCYNDCGNYNYYQNGQEEWAAKHVIRPWRFEGTTSDTAGRFVPMNTLKSIGSGIGYFVYPVYFNDIYNRLTVAQSSMSIGFESGLGLVDGDIIVVQGSTKKFIMHEYQGSGTGVQLGIQYTV